MANKTDNNGNGAVHLVIVRDFVVAQDIIDTVREKDPLARVVVATDCDAATRLILRQDRIGIAILEAGPARVVRARLDAAISERGGAIVLLGDEAEDAWDRRGAENMPWPVLMRPFSSANVHALFASLRPARGT